MRFIFMKRIFLSYKGQGYSHTGSYSGKARVKGILLLMILCVSTLKAQVDSNVSMYWAVPTQFNPAAAGSDSLLRISAFERTDMGQTFFIAADMPLEIGGKKQGVGVSAFRQNIDSLTSTRFGAQYAYSIKLNRKSSLTLGTQLGVINKKFDPSAMKGNSNTTIPDNINEDLIPDQDGTEFDFAFGALYQKRIARNDLYLGLSAHSTNAYYFLAGGNIPVSRTLYIVQPSLLVRATKQNTQVEATLRATYDHRFWGGVSYRYDDAVVLMLGADIQHFRIGYAYDVGLSGLAKESHGSHEILASYFLKLDLNKKKPHPMKSIRIL